MNPVIITRDESIVTGLDTVVIKKKPKKPFEMEKFSSLQNIQNMMQISHKVSYDICKNNEHVAKLILLRGSFKLGEPVIGVVDFEASVIPCFQMSVYLETTESVEQPFALKTKSQLSKLTRRVHSEYHKYTLNTKRTSILLSIPMACSPDFQTTVSKILCF
jgi:hypothetical protein